MARPPEGPKLVDRLEGADESKKRLRAILETIAGQRSVDEACSALGISPARFHELRNKILQAALVALEPQPAGRPRAPSDEQDPRIAELEAELKDLKIEVAAAKVREEIALTMPHVLEPEGSKKRWPSKVLDKIKSDRKRRR